MGGCCGGMSTSQTILDQAPPMTHTPNTSPVGFSGHVIPSHDIPDHQYKEPQQLEHIADREDLTNMEGTMFLEKAKRARRMMRNGRSKTYADRKRHSSARLSLAGNFSPVLIKKANSCSTIYTDDSTVSQPNLKVTLKCVSLAVFYHLKNRDRDREPRTLPIFDEKLHPLSKENVSPHYADYTPDHKVIYKFVKMLFHAAQLTAECAIIALIYMERLLHYADLDLHPCNWKRILLGAILLASKVWDDQAVWNVDYCQILRDIAVEDMNELERVYLEQIQFYVNIASRMYASYYFDLRSLAEDNGLMFPNEHELLTKDRAKKLEAITFHEDRLMQPINMKRSASSEPLSPKNVAILM